MFAYDYIDGSGWVLKAGPGPFPNAEGWDYEKNYATIHSADIDGDGKAELLGRRNAGMVAYDFNGTSWVLKAGPGPFPDAEGWDEAKYYATIHSADIDGDEVDELLARGAAGMVAYRLHGTSWELVAGDGPFALEQRYGNYGGYACARWIGYGNPDWMAGIPDDRRISELSIPGTHDTMSLHQSDYPFALNLMPINQSMPLIMQLASGIRVLDIRCRHDSDRFNIFHGPTDQHATFHGVLNPVVDFLRTHPTETVLMSIAQAPEPVNNTRSFAETFEWYMDLSSPWGGTYRDWVWHPTSANPTLGDVRGKIVIYDAFSEPPPACGEAVDSGGDIGWYTSLALDGDDKPHISYYDETNGDLKYARWTGSEWIYESVDYGSEVDVGLHTSLAVDGDGHPHISYYGQTNGDLKYAHWTGSEWDIQTVDSDGVVGQFTSLALDGDDKPHISYYDATNGDLKYAYLVGDEWVFYPVDSEETDEVGGYTSIAVSPAGQPRISYYDWTNGDLKVAFLMDPQNRDWLFYPVDSEGTVGKHTSIAVSAEGQTHISYHDETNDCLKYAYLTPSGWVFYPVDSEGTVGKFTSLALGADGYPHISYYDATNGNLKYYRWIAWSKLRVDGGGVGKYTSQALDAAGNPHISYYDWANGDLKYAGPSCFCGEGQQITPFGLKWGMPCQSVQNAWELSSHPELRTVKWPAVETQLQQADEGDLDKLFVNYLSATQRGGYLGFYPVLPLFVASGHCTQVPLDYSELGNPCAFIADSHLWAGIYCHLDGDGYPACNAYAPWPIGDCSDSVCKVYYTGTNELTTRHLNLHPPQGQPRRWGIIMVDLPGPGLIDAIIRANYTIEVTPNPRTQWCRQSDEIGAVTFTARHVALGPVTAATIPDPLPDTLTLTDNDCTTSGGIQTCEWVLEGTLDQPAGRYGITVVVTDSGGGIGSDHTSIVVPWEIYLPAILRSQ
jgi:hypothetical protein